MVFSYNWLQSFFKKKLPKSEKLAELLTMHSFETTVDRSRSAVDWVLDIDISPNRAPDCFSHLGIAREIAVITNRNFSTGVKKFKLKEDKNLRADNFVRVDIKHNWACPRYTARVVTDVKVGPSPKWIRERLKVCGLRPINNIVDIVNYAMLETGQPLHAFDGEKLEDKKIIVRFAKRNERIVTLDEEKYDLDEDILIIADAKKPVAIAGIKGGKIPEIERSTKIVVLESANFNSKIIRRGSREIDLKTDSSWRFEHGIDPNLTEIAINRAAYLIQEIAGGRVAKGIIDKYRQKVLPKRIKLDLDYAKSLLGIEIPKNEVLKILKRLEFKILDSKFKILKVEIPTVRLDISLPEDLIEEIGRIYGYEKIPATFPTTSLIPPKRNLEIFWEDITKNILKEAGFSEVYNYSFISEKDAKNFGYKAITRLQPSRHPARENIYLPNLVEVENPISLEQKYLRPSLIPNLLKNVQRNQKRFEEIRIFELGKIFQVKTEKRTLTGLVAGKTEGFYQLKGTVDLLLNKLGISNIWYDSYQPSAEKSKIAIWHPKKCAEIKIDHQEIGFLGEISSRILEDFKIEGKVILFNLDFEKLQRFSSEEAIYQPISPFPAAIRDIAVLVPRGVRVVEVLNKINTAGGPLIRDIDLFDIYEGERIPRGKKNLAFHIIYQAEDRTLFSKEIDEIQQKIIKTLEKEPDWQVRK